jgi:hypothetical protein
LASTGDVSEVRATVEPMTIACLIRMEGFPFSNRPISKKDCDDCLPRRLPETELLNALEMTRGSWRDRGALALVQQQGDCSSGAQTSNERRG